MSQRSRLTAFISALGLMAIATSIAADESPALLARAMALQEVQEDLAVRVDACPDGKCQDAKQILGDFGKSHAELTSIEQDRQALEPCTQCGPVDAVIEVIKQNDADIAGIVVSWEESS